MQRKQKVKQVIAKIFELENFLTISYTTKTVHIKKNCAARDVIPGRACSYNKG